MAGRATPGVGPVRSIWGTANDDLFVSGETGVIHFDGVRWSPLRTPTGLVVSAMWGANSRVGMFGYDNAANQAKVLWLHRQALWQRRASETACSDGIDDDCDDKIDGDDTDCP